MDKIALNAMDRHGFMTDHKFAGGDSLNDLRSLYGRIKPSDTDYKNTIQSLTGFNKRDRLSVVNPTSKLVGVADFPRRMADHKPSLDEIRSKAAYKLGLSQNRYSGYGGHRIPSKIETNPALKDYMSRPKTASFDYDEMVKMAYEDIVDGFEKEAESIGQMAARRAMSNRPSSGRPLGVKASSLSSGGISFSSGSSTPSKSVSFESLNKQTSNWNNGVSRNISPTSGAKMSMSDMVARNNNSVFKQNNGAYPSKLYK